jgi:bacterial/archaeal transporter family-2 protein
MWSAFIFAVLGGASFVVQQAVNANLRAEIGYPFWAGFVSYLGGTIAMLLMVLIMREPWLTLELAGRSSALSWTGGIFGAMYIAISILLLPHLGAATLISLIVFGQMLTSVIFDHYGLLGIPEHLLTVSRMLGAALLVVGVVLVRL